MCCLCSALNGLWVASLSPAAHSLSSTLTLPAFSSWVPMATPVSPYHSSIYTPPFLWARLHLYPSIPRLSHTSTHSSTALCAGFYCVVYMCHCVCGCVCMCLWRQGKANLGLRKQSVSECHRPADQKDQYVVRINDTIWPVHVYLWKIRRTGLYEFRAEPWG